MLRSSDFAWSLPAERTTPQGLIQHVSNVLMLLPLLFENIENTAAVNSASLWDQFFIHNKMLSWRKQRDNSVVISLASFPLYFVLSLFSLPDGRCQTLIMPIKLAEVGGGLCAGLTPLQG